MVLGAVGQGDGYGGVGMYMIAVSNAGRGGSGVRGDMDGHGSVLGRRRSRDSGL